MKRKFLPFTLTLCALIISIPGARLLAEQAAGGAVNMLDTQSQNEGLIAVPAKGTVTIDGKLDDWDWSGRIWSFPDYSLRDQYSVETAAMWDKDYLYLAMKWKDPTPMVNQINPKYNPTDGWKSDSIQLRIKTDHPLWLTAWYYTGEGTSNVVVQRWKNPEKVREGQDSTYFFGKPGSADLGEGMQMAFAKADGGYVQEMRIPWAVLYHQKPDMQAGSKLKIGFEYLWGTAAGTDRPAYRYTDNMQPGKTSRDFFWFEQDEWGDVALSGTGNLPVRQYHPANDVAGRAGPVKLAFNLPREAKKLTLAIDDEKGRRVRNLVADCSPGDFATGETQTDYQITAYWDGRNDAGAVVAPGKYHARGLWHKGLDAVYDMTFYNPGTPPWDTSNGTGDWGGNEPNPNFVVASGNRMVLTWPFTEGGNAIIGVGPDGLKKWGELWGADPIAADDEFVYPCLRTYAWMTPGHAMEDKLFRLQSRDGQGAAFVLDGKERAYPLPVADILGEKQPPLVAAMAAYKGSVAMAMEGGELVILDGSSAAVRSRWQTGKKITALAYSGKGGLFAVADGGIAEVDAATGKFSVVNTPGLKDAGAMAVDREGNILVYDRGPDQQVKAYSVQGGLAYTAGVKGGRPIRGAFDPQAMNSVSSIAVDAKDQVWAVESTFYPRRISVWGRDGKLVRDYIGPAHYAGTDCFLDDEDPTLAYFETVEMKIDRENHTQKVTQILWKADETRADEPVSFDSNPDKSGGGGRQRFRSSAGGVEREYYFRQAPHFVDAPNVLFMKGDTGWRPVAAVGLVGALSGKVDRGRTKIEDPSGEFAGLSVWDGFFWNDENGDGRVQRNECIIVPSKPSKDGVSRPSEWALPLSADKHGTMNPADLSFLVNGIYRYKPLRYTKEGAPVYGPQSIQKIGGDDFTRLFPFGVPEENLIIGLQTEPGGNEPWNGLLGLDSRNGTVIWNYPNPYPGVHGSHSAPMPKPGYLIGPIKIIGAARVDDEVGRVFDIRGNLGRDFFFTTDGLYVGTLFQDSRYPIPALPGTEEDARGKSLNYATEGGECFNGWMGRQSDGKIRMVTGLANKAGMVVEIKGLDGIKRFQGPQVTLTEQQIKEIAAASPAQAAVQGKAGPPACKIVKVAAPLPVSGDEAVWKNITALTIAKPGFPEKAEVQMAHDERMLYLRYNVTDASPMLNGGQDFRRLFKSGDAVDLQIGPAEPADRKDPAAGDSRLVFSFLKGEPVAVLMRPVDSSAPGGLGETYTSPVGSRHFDRVERLGNVTITAVKSGTGYVLTAAVPLEDLGIKPNAGLKLRGDVGFISSDTAGRIDAARTYWSNQETGLTNDEPLEAWFFPQKWGVFTLE